MATSAVPSTDACDIDVTKESAGVTRTPPPTPSNPDAKPAVAPVTAKKPRFSYWDGAASPSPSDSISERRRYLVTGTVGATPIKKVPNAFRNVLPLIEDVHLAPMGAVSIAESAITMAAFGSKHPSFA